MNTIYSTNSTNSTNREILLRYHYTTINRNDPLLEGTYKDENGTEIIVEYYHEYGCTPIWSFSDSEFSSVLEEYPDLSSLTEEEFFQYCTVHEEDGIDLYQILGVQKYVRDNLSNICAKVTKGSFITVRIPY